MEAASVGISLYQAGGLALLLLGIIVAAGVVVFRFLSTMITSLGLELKELRQEMIGSLAGVVAENTKSNVSLQNEVARQTIIISQWGQVLRERLPFNGGIQQLQQHHITPLPGP